MPTYQFAIYQFDDVTGTGNALTTSSTVGTTGSFTIDGTASPITLQVFDDDGTFHDAYIDTGTSQTLAADVTINGVTYLAADNPIVELEFAVDTTSGDTFLYIRIDGVNVGIGGLVLPEPGITYTIDSSSDGQLRPFDELACFVRGTLIDTIDGPKPVETLAVGDMIRVQDGFAPLRWLGQRHLTNSELRKSPKLYPVRIKAGAMGNSRDLLVSPQHRMLICDWRAQMYYGEDYLLVPAKTLVDDDNVVIADELTSVSYFHLLFEKHEVVYSEGILSESFHPGSIGIGGLDTVAQVELAYLFPEICADPEDYGNTAYPAIPAGQAQAIEWASAA